MTIEAFASAKADLLTRRLAYQRTRARKRADQTAVHDLRVAIRRLDECLRVFRSLLPEKATRKKRRRLRRLMKAAGAVRNVDIALELLRASDCGDDNLRRKLLEERANARKDLMCLA